MKSILTLFAVTIVIAAGPVAAQTADHAPTKPAADAADQYDKGLRPADAARNADDSSTGGSTGTAPSGKDNGAPDTRGAPQPETRREQQK